MRIEGGAGEENWSEDRGWSWRGELERRTGVRIEGGAGEGNWSEDRGWSWRGDLE